LIGGESSLLAFFDLKPLSFPLSLSPRLVPDPLQPDKDCGPINCGYCNAGEVCNANNRCVPKPPQPCQPKTRCDVGVVCGFQVCVCVCLCVFVCI
jgi:hypothetical protein